MNKAKKPLPQSLEDAIAWHVRINSGMADEATMMAFTRWLEADEANRMAFDQVESLDVELDAMTPTEIGALSRYHDEDDAAPIVRPSSIPRSLRPRWIALGSMLAAGLMLTVGHFSFDWKKPAAEVFTTRIGERRTVTLADGSEVELNTDTRIVVLPPNAVRRVVLVRGEALFHVAKDAGHPFIVSVRDRAVRVVGTVFNILSNDGTIAISVAEGRVLVAPQLASGQIDLRRGVQLKPGDQLGHSVGTNNSWVSHVDAERVMAWRNGFLVYENATLSSVVRDLNRYFSHRISLADKKLGDRRFSGVLKIDNESAVLTRISQFVSVVVVHQPDGDVVLRRSPRSD